MCPAKWLLFAAAVAVCAPGCGTRRVTDTPRSATELLLISAAVEQAMTQLDFSFLRDRSVFLDDRYLHSIDRPFVVGTFRARALSEGVILADWREEADYVVEMRAGAVGVDRSDFVLGIPATDVPTTAGAFALPEASVYKSIRQTGACRVSFVAYRRDDGRFLYESGPAFGFSDHLSWWVLGIGPGIRQNVQPGRTPENTSRVGPSPVGPEPPGHLPDVIPQPSPE